MVLMYYYCLQFQSLASYYGLLSNDLSLSAKKPTKAQQRVLQLDQAHDQRKLNDDEVRERGTAKDKILALAAVRKIRLRQWSKLTWVRVDDANTKLFHLKANARRWKNFIPSLQVNDQVHTSHEAKTQALHNFYKN
jgi:hypothetical protein